MKILENKLINKSELARLMWPENKNPEKRLGHKINDSGNQRMTIKDKQLIKDILIPFFEKSLLELKNEDII